MVEGRRDEGGGEMGGEKKWVVVADGKERGEIFSKLKKKWTDQLECDTYHTQPVM